jgi:hypothetical protein
MKSIQTPRVLTFHGRTLVSSGEGKVRHSVLYFDPSLQRLLEFFICTVKTIGQAYLAVSVEGNSQFKHVRVTHGSVAGGVKVGVGDTLLIGELHQQGSEVRAESAWLLAPCEEPGPAPATIGRAMGTIVFARGTWAKISTDADGTEVFAHETQWRPAVSMQVGQRCSFIKAKTDKGVAAYDIQIAA